MRCLRLMIAVAFLPAAIWAQPALREIKVEVSNPSDQARAAEDIVIPFTALRQVAPEINAGSLMVTVPFTAAENRGPQQSMELPSQADDLDGDGKADELVFQIELQPKQTRTVTITYGEPDLIYRMRSQYSKRTYALFAAKIEGPGWESEQNAWRLYFDSRNAIDIYGKRRGSMFLDIVATPEYNYHADTPNGRDIYKVGNALGIGAVGAWVDGKAVKVAEVATRKWQIIANGPVRSIIELTYEGWKVGGRSITLRSRIEQWAGDRGFFHKITAQDAEGLTFATGLPVKPDVLVFRSETNATPAWLATYGEQVVQPGPTATEELKGTNLGLAIVSLAGTSSAEQDDANYLLTFPLERGSASWYVAAAWDQEGMNNGVAVGTPPLTSRIAVSPSTIKTTDTFLRWLSGRRAELSVPAQIQVLPKTP